MALEMYRIEEEKAINHLADILTAYGIDVSAEEIRTTETETLKTTVREKVEGNKKKQKKQLMMALRLP